MLKLLMQNFCMLTNMFFFCVGNKFCEVSGKKLRCDKIKTFSNARKEKFDQDFFPEVFCIVFYVVKIFTSATYSAMH